jgi:hypothetical protein
VAAALADGDDAGVPHGALLAAFAQDVCLRSAELPDLRARLVEAVGMEGMVEASATVAIFNGLVRVADGTGIPLDDGTVSASGPWRGKLGLDRFAGAANSAEAGRGTTADANDVRSLFS